MQSFQWGRQFVTGLPTIDQQHQRLVNLINDFGEHLTANALTFDEIGAVLNELSGYAHRHFQDEEELMTQTGVDARHASVHVQLHQTFLRDVRSMRAGMTERNPQAAAHLLDFLVHWLAFHILVADQNMARQIDSIRAGASPQEAYEREERRSDDSTEPLLAALTGLFQQVTIRNRELLELNRSLEAKVAERTSALSEANRHLEELALTDGLTGVPNRRHAMRRLADLWRESLESQAPLSCIMIDSDHFKEINDEYGHDAGDALLCELAKALVHTVRTDDIVCRLGGDEFLIICPNTDREGGIQVAELARKRIAEMHLPIGATSCRTSISAGVAVRDPAMSSHEALIKLADRGVYAAKRDGRNCVRAVPHSPDSQAK